MSNVCMPLYVFLNARRIVAACIDYNLWWGQRTAAAALAASPLEGNTRLRLGRGTHHHLSSVIFRNDFRVSCCKMPCSARGPIDRYIHPFATVYVHQEGSPR